MAKKNPVEGEDLFIEANKVHTASTKIKELLGPDLEKINYNIEIPGEDRKPCYVVKHRIKPPSDIVAKVRRKRHGAPKGSENYYYNPEHVTDGLGYRFVTLFHQDILLVVDELIKLFKHEHPYQGNPIPNENGLAEAIIYTNRPIDEEGAVHTLVAKSLNDAGFKIETLEPINRKGGYSSVHFVVNVPLPGSSAISTMEIQVRDIFEESWTEIDHTLRYVNEREGKQLEDIPGSWVPHLSALKTFADGCSQHASLIKANAIDHMKINVAGGEVLPSVEPTEGAEILIKALPKEFHVRVQEAFEAEKRAVIAITKQSRQAEFFHAADLFKELYKDTEIHHKVKTADGRNVRFNISMEYAFCIQPGPDNVDQQAEVIEIYTKMQDEFPDDPFPYYRHATALQSRKHYDEAVKLYEKGMDVLENGGKAGRNIWVSSAMPRSLGLVYWKKGIALYEAGDKDEAMSSLERAIEYARIAVDAVVEPIHFDELSKSLNNLLYFIFELVTRFKEKATPEKLEEMVNLAKRLEPEIKRKKTSQLDPLHTLLVVYVTLGDSDGAKAKANQIAPILFEIAKRNSGDENLPLNNVKQYLDEDLLEIYEDALKVLF